MAKLVREFGPIPDQVSKDIGSDLGNHGMKVELVHLHDKDSETHGRATWRVRCPLSIAVQILRQERDAGTRKGELVHAAIDSIGDRRAAGRPNEDCRDD